MHNTDSKKGACKEQRAPPRKHAGQKERNNNRADLYKRKQLPFARRSVVGEDEPGLVLDALFVEERDNFVD